MHFVYIDDSRDEALRGEDELAGRDDLLTYGRSCSRFRELPISQPSDLIKPLLYPLSYGGRLAG
jgi:hypothetical protein